jgi:beta-glucanase (GH16 family)
MNKKLKQLLLLLVTIAILSCAKDSSTNLKENPIVTVEPETNELVIPTTGYETPETYNGMVVVFTDEFNDDALDTNKWNFQIGDGCPDICGWGNNELEYYRKENTFFKNGSLIIEAKKENFGGKNYTSSRINTQEKFTLKYGRIDIRAVLPKGQGIWPAFWMLGENINTVGWPTCGEIDIMEMIGGQGRENTTYGTTHWDNAGSYANYGGPYTLSNGVFNDEFHVFTIVWDEKFIKWFIDDVQFHEIDITPPELSEFHRDFHLLINLAIGGNWPGNPDNSTIFPQYLIVDYLRVFKNT